MTNTFLIPMLLLAALALIELAMIVYLARAVGEQRRHLLRLTGIVNDLLESQSKFNKDMLSGQAGNLALFKLLVESVELRDQKEQK
jgi:hypothetical protein